jgi:hypothetical protein
MNLQHVTVEELKDFCRCPFLYEKKYILLEEPDRRRSSSHFDGHSYIVREAEEAIQDLASFYFHRLMDNRQVRYETLYHRWEKIWWDDITAQEIMDSIIPVNRSSRVRINSNLMEHLPKFHKNFHKPFCPVAVDRPISLPNGNSILDTQIQMAYKLPTGRVRIVKFLPTRIAPGKPTQDLDLIAQACAWMHSHDEDSVEVAYYCMLSPKEYEPFTVGRLTKEAIPNLLRVVKAFHDRKAVTEINCTGCEYVCKE